MYVLYIALAAAVGGIASALLGYLDSGTSFDWKKFIASLIRAFVAAAVFAVGYSYSDGITPLDIGAAFIAGAGFDVLGNRGIGAIKNLLNKGG